MSLPYHVPELEVNMLRLPILISGMSCGGCVNNVRTALSAVHGVQESHVKVGEATVTYDPELTSPDALRAAIVNAGYAIASPTTAH